MQGFWKDSKKHVFKDKRKVVLKEAWKGYHNSEKQIISSDNVLKIKVPIFKFKTFVIENNDINIEDIRLIPEKNGIVKEYFSKELILSQTKKDIYFHYGSKTSLYIEDSLFKQERPFYLFGNKFVYIPKEILFFFKLFYGIDNSRFFEKGVYTKNINEELSKNRFFLKDIECVGFSDHIIKYDIQEFINLSGQNDRDYPYFSYKGINLGYCECGYHHGRSAKTYQNFANRKTRKNHKDYVKKIKEEYNSFTSFDYYERYFHKDHGLEKSIAWEMY